MKRLVNVRIFYTFSGSIIAKLAVFATKGPWGHVGIAFEYSDGSIVCFEARSDEGFVGPFPFQDVKDYVNARGGKYFIGKPLEIDTEDVQKIYQKAISMIGSVSYSKGQLGLIFLAERYGLPIRRSPNKIVCSEGVAVLVYPNVDLRDCDHDTVDKVTPNSVYYRDCEIQAGYNSGRVRDIK